ncbi:MAG: amino acid adenylation domain-containing protein [Pseudomonadota bacterium]|nr:amino acid adenylation domain-containing protein [Pseudomonadota bacterium]
MASCRCVHDLITMQCLRDADKDAISWRGDNLSYAQLDVRANRMANYLRVLGVGPEVVVGVCADPSFDLIVSLLAILKAGGVYLPLEPSYPAARLNQIAADADAAILIMPDRRSGDFQGGGIRLLCLEAEAPWIAEQPEVPPASGVTEDNLAYLMYTSGSTGRPKGVMISHAALLQKLIQPGAWGPIAPSVRTALVGSIAFDASLSQILLPLSHGGTLVLLDLADRLTPDRLWRALSEAKVNVLDCTPSWLASMLSVDGSRVALDRIVVGGESFPPPLAKAVWRIWPKCRIVNVYGPTECCIDAAAYELSKADPDAPSVPIGTALPGYRLYVLDDDLESVPAGETGELYIAGRGLARGYWRDPVQTESKFLADVFHPRERMYRAGDRAIRRADGVLVFCGRIDNQVKIRGQRVELDEIENLIRMCPEVDTVSVLLRNDIGTEPRLVAYVSRSAQYIALSHDRLSERLREYAQKMLPPHMLPGIWMTVDKWPLTPTGKLDRLALPPPSFDDSRRTLTAPRDRTEEDMCRIWAEVLGLPAVGIDDNFFELGGHSLLSSRLLTRINAHFRSALPLVALFYNPTVADLSIALTRSAHSANSSRLIRFNQTTCTPPLFCIPPLSGVGTVYAGLARALRQDCSVYALQATGLAKDPPGSSTMTELAATFIGEMHKVQPEGPYHLCGYSAGGVIAYEMCHQLAASGQQVATLVLIDPYCNEPYDGDAGYGSRRFVADDEHFWQLCRELVGDMGLIDAAADPAIDLVKILWAHMSVGSHLPPAAGRIEEKALLALAARALGDTMDLEVFRLMIEGARNIFSAYCGYQPYSLSLAPRTMRIVQPDADSGEFRLSRLVRWQALVGPSLEAHVVPGKHASMLTKWQTVESMAALIRSLLPRETHRTAFVP